MEAGDLLKMRSLTAHLDPSLPHAHSAPVPSGRCLRGAGLNSGSSGQALGQPSTERGPSLLSEALGSDRRRSEADQYLGGPADRSATMP
mmetsp:Transcript_36559/g.82617  ORF Transcript_36559/g.82617 Transcript_36559/m.82617 type:complete len:89 (+) Transcript_36559:1439-1705(+)